MFVLLFIYDFLKENVLQLNKKIIIIKYLNMEKYNSNLWYFIDICTIK